MAIERLVNKNPGVFILISVPTEVLKEQWLEEIIKKNLLLNCRVEIINTIVKSEWDVDFLICDECHLLPSNQFKKIFNCVSYKLIMCLTGTLERLDGKEIIIKQYAPVCDTITIDEAVKNCEKLAVIDKNVTFGIGGALYTDIKAKIHKDAYGFIAGLGGRDITPDAILEVYEKTKNVPEKEVTWIGLKEE